MKVWRHPLWLPLHRSTPGKSLEASAEAGGVPSYGAKPKTCTMYIYAVSASCWLSYKGKRCDTDIGLGGQPGNGQGTSKLCSSRRENLVSLSQGVQLFWFLSFFCFMGQYLSDMMLFILFIKFIIAQRLTVATKELGCEAKMLKPWRLSNLYINIRSKSKETPFQDNIFQFNFQSRFWATKLPQYIFVSIFNNHSIYLCSLSTDWVLPASTPTVATLMGQQVLQRWSGFEIQAGTWCWPWKPGQTSFKVSVSHLVPCCLSKLCDLH